MRVNKAFGAHDGAMPYKRPPETERDRSERVEQIGQQIAEAIKLDGETLRTEQNQRRDWRSNSN